MFSGHSNMHGSYVYMFGGGGGGGVSDFCVTQNFYHLTQTMDSEVFPLLWDIVRTVCNV